MLLRENTRMACFMAGYSSNERKSSRMQKRRLSPITSAPNIPTAFFIASCSFIFSSCEPCGFNFHAHAPGSRVPDGICGAPAA